jgi:Ca-activated chloride channel family protein
MMKVRRTLAAVFIMAVCLAAAAQEHTFRVTAEEVRIDVLVTDEGRPVTDLRAADFQILDNGVPQEIEYATLQQKMPVSVTLVFDMSQSVAGELLVRLKEAAYALLADLKDEDRAALITFSNAVALGSPLTRDLAGINASYAGLVMAETKADMPLLIVFSDGLDTFSWLTGDAVLETAKRSDTVVYAVSASRLPDKAFLRDLTEYSGGSLFHVESTGDLAAVFLNILDEFRRRYMVTYTPQGVAEGGWHMLDVDVKRPGLQVRARPGYIRKSPEERTK